MWRIIFLILILFSSMAFAQTQEKPQAILQDVIGGRMGDCDRSSRLQNLYLGISQYPNSRGVVITYQGINALPSEYDLPPPMYLRLKTNLLFMRMESNIKIINGGFRSNMETEFWFVPQGADEPNPSQVLPKPTILFDKTYLYAKENLVDYELSDIPFEFLSRSAQKEIIKEQTETEEENKKNGVEIDNAEYEPTFTEAELEEMKFAWAKSKFGEGLKNQKDSIGTIIFYGDKDEYNLKAVRAHVEEAKNRIVKESQLQPNQIKVVYGGFRYSLEAEFWVTPNGAKLPTPKPEKKEDNDSTE